MLVHPRAKWLTRTFGTEHTWQTCAKPIGDADRNRNDSAVVSNDVAHQNRDRKSDRIPRRAFEFAYSICGSSHRLGNRCQPLGRQVGARLPRELLQCETGDSCRTEQQHSGVAVLTDDPGMHRIRMYAADRGKLATKAPGVERGAGTNDIDHASRPASGEVLGKKVERTRRHQTDARKSAYLDVPGHLIADGKIRACQVQAGLAGGRMTTERHDEHILGFDGSQRTSTNLAGPEHGQRMSEIESFPFGVTLGSVIDRQARDE